MHVRKVFTVFFFVLMSYHYEFLSVAFVFSFFALGKAMKQATISLKSNSHHSRKNIFKIFLVLFKESSL